MTALERYLRLEAVGVWREHCAAPAREVVVSLGRSTLVLTDLDERPRHWALAGVAAVGRDGPPTIYSMTADGEETLAIREPDMVAAIAAVARPALATPQTAAASRWRRPVAAAVVLALLALLVVAIPRAIRAATARMIPPELAAELGDRMLIELVERHGSGCAGPDAATALGRLAQRLHPAPPPRLRVVDHPTPVATLPGGIIVLGRNSLTAAAVPEVIAGWIQVGLLLDPVAGFVRTAGPLAEIGFLLGRGFGEPVIARAAAAAATSSPLPRDIDAALARLAAAGSTRSPSPAQLNRPELRPLLPAPTRPRWPIRNGRRCGPPAADLRHIGLAS